MIKSIYRKRWYKTAIVFDKTAIVSDETAIVSDKNANSFDKTAIVSDETAIVSEKTLPRGFCKFIVEPIYALCNEILSGNREKALKMIEGPCGVVLDRD